METIGSRLRKRRRTSPLPHDEDTEDMSTTPKRANSRKTVSGRGKRGQADTLGQEMIHSSNTEMQASSEDLPKTENSSPKAPPPVTGPSEQPRQEEPASHQLPRFEQRSIQGVSTPDINDVVAGIMNHGDTVDTFAAQSNAIGMVDTESFRRLGASLHLKTQSLQVLDNLATQIINTLAKSSYHEIIMIATRADSDDGEAYTTLKSLFDHTKKVYSITEPFLNPYQLGLVENAHLEAIRKANMATFVSSVFGSQDVGFYHLHENFLDTFVPDGGRLLKNQAQLFLDLKTQAYISAATTGQRSKEDILEDLFPRDLEDRLLRRRPGTKQLSPSELEFVQRARNRRKALLEESTTDAAIAALPGKYVWEAFLKDISTYVSKNFEAIAGIATRKNPHPNRAPNFVVVDQNKHPRSQQHSEHQQHTQHYPNQDGLKEEPDGGPAVMGIVDHQIDPSLSGTEDITEKAARAVRIAMQDSSGTRTSTLPPQPKQNGQSPTESQAPAPTRQPIEPIPPPQIRYHFEHPLHPEVPAPPAPPYFQHVSYQHSQQLQPPWQGRIDVAHPQQSFNDQQLIPYPTQSAPTHILYERARQATTAKASPNTRRSGPPSQRRPWNIEEENSLMAGLDRVKGPHWSQILAMFGPGGTINEVLKDRNQVQLKDKARNLKLFFLKSGIEVPYYLQFVTGELKTRAPAQAAKNEAKDREMAREDRAHVEGLMALAGGSMQESDQTMTELEDQADREMQNGDVALADASNSHGTIIDNLTASVGMQDWIDGPRSNANPGLSGMEEMVRAAQDGHRERRTQQAQMLPTNGHPDGVANRGSTGRSASFNPQFLGAHKTVVDSSNTDPALLA